MKILFLLLILSACGPKDKFQEIPYSPKKTENTLSTEQDWNKYSPQIDIMVAFLWPTHVEVKDRQKLSEIIQTARDLKAQKEDYLLKKRQIQVEFDHFQCGCVINMECTGEEQDLNTDKCYEIEENMYANDRELVPIFGLVEKIKSNVMAIGGEWLKTHLDFRELPNSSMDLSHLQIKFTALDAYEEEGVSLPYSYEISKALLFEEQYFKRLNFTFKREKYLSPSEKIHYGDWSVDAAVVPSEASLLFQGKLFWTYEGKKREGLIYWEHPRIEW